MTHMPNLSRRGFIVASAAATGGLALGIRAPLAEAQVARAAVGPEVTAWVVIQPDDTVIVRVARSEMGQGAMTALPQLVCEELECDWTKVKAEYAPPHENLKRNRVWGAMSTGGSQGTRGSQDYLRKAGATAREMLIAAAAREWGVPASQCTAKNSVITHAASGRSTTFGKVANAAAQLPPPADVKLKDQKDWTLIGKPVGRLDLFEKVTGQPIYGSDANPPGVVHAAIAHCPVFGGKVVSYDEAKIRGRKGLQQVVNLGNAVVVVADNTWTAQQALNELPITWDEGPNAKVSSASIAEFLKAGLTATDAGVGRKDGDALRAIAGAAKRVEAEYSVPFLAHSCMEPMNCTAHVVGDKVEIWVSTQNGEAALASAAQAANVPPANVIVHKMHQGGGFGRRGAVQDYTREAVQVAKAVGKPVKLTWSREEDTQHDYYRPVVMAKMTAGLDADGKVVGWHARISGNSIIGSLLPQNLPADGVDRQFLSGWTQEFGYDVPNYLCDLSMRITHVPVGFWRAVNHTQNAFFKECFVDEMAHAAGKDPYEFRRAMLQKSPRDLAVLDAAAKAAGWGTPLPAGIFRGIAENYGYGSYVANVVEVSVSPAGEFKLHRVVTAVDCGTVVNPRICHQQVESGTVYGLTAILYGEITIKDGRVEQSNFHDYEMLRIHEMPKVETVLVPSGGFWGGMGEPTLAPLAPAIGNAIFAATGKRIRSLPLKNHDLKKA